MNSHIYVLCTPLNCVFVTLDLDPHMYIVPHITQNGPTLAQEKFLFRWKFGKVLSLVSLVTLPRDVTKIPQNMTFK